MAKNFILIVAASLCLTLSSGQVKPDDAKIDYIIQLINKKESRLLLAEMADSCRIGNLPPLDNAGVLPQILANFSPIVDYRIADRERQANGDLRIHVASTYASGRKGNPTLTFNDDLKLVNLGIVHRREVAEPEQALKKALVQATRPDTVRIPFKLKDNLIYVPAVLNGKDGFFMFDNGAPVLILQGKYVPTQNINSNIAVDFTGVGGAMQDIKWSTGNSLSLGGMQLDGFDAPVSTSGDMDVGNVAIFGLMGAGIYDDYQITFDYKNQELFLEKVGEEGDLTGFSFNHGAPKGKAALTLKRHIPIVDLEIAGKVVPLGIDCGANANLLKTEMANQIQSAIAYLNEQVSIAGAGALPQSSQTANLKQAKVAGLLLQDMYTVFTDQAIGAGAGEHALPIEGLLGAPFLNQYKVTLNYNKGEIVFY
ncbi:aspartyl protease family protein [Sphingobacterium griseoflavum]|uniref:Aspartyl protease n=1 Tax=Sphingobacterium griseoflavum TaxID=1474952 RepID=A0ABQ3HY32_9SPHI|nr:aspartyl protease family protein [Sphingobacterium griseoflavum]GHE45937.1 hypothetical protein GCM10017764_31540 [Sphingobacterium griseoflavum]